MCDILLYDNAFTICRTPEDYVDFNNGRPSSKSVSEEHGIYIPLERQALVLPPAPDEAFWSMPDVRRIISPFISDENKRLLGACIARRKGVTKKDYFVFGLPHPSGQRTLFGISASSTKAAPTLWDAGHDALTHPIYIARRDRTALIGRGGGQTGVSEKHVLLVGCGSLGGHIAFELVRGGVLNLTLVDYDTLSPDNTFRHVLGRGYWLTLKTNALKTALETQFPYVRVRSVPLKIGEALRRSAHDNDAVRLKNYDLVILATGNPTAELYINDLIHSKSPEDLAMRSPLAIFTWLEPLGIGGHALQTGYGARGCFRCLYTPTLEDKQEDEPEFRYNRASFAEKDQSFTRTLTGCDSVYTPFSSTHVVQTAAMAVNLALHALQDESGL